MSPLPVHLVTPWAQAELLVLTQDVGWNPAFHLLFADRSEDRVAPGTSRHRPIHTQIQVAQQLSHLLVESGSECGLVCGLMRIDEVNGELGIDLPENDDYETVAGFILCQLRRIPVEGEQLHHGDVEITVQETKGPKIEKVLIAKR